MARMVDSTHLMRATINAANANALAQNLKQRVERLESIIGTLKSSIEMLSHMVQKLVEKFDND